MTGKGDLAWIKRIRLQKELSGNNYLFSSFPLFFVLMFCVRRREEAGTGFGFTIVASSRERGGRQFTPFPFKEEVIPTAFIAQQAEVVAAMCYISIVTHIS